MIEIGSPASVFASTLRRAAPARCFILIFGPSKLIRDSRFEFRVFLFYFVQLDFELLLPLVQHLQAQLPPMKLNTRLINVAGDLGPLRFVFGQATLDFLPADSSIRRGFFRCWDCRGFAASLTTQGHSRRGAVHHQRFVAMFASKENVRIVGLFRMRLHCASFLHESE